MRRVRKAPLESRADPRAPRIPWRGPFRIIDISQPVSSRTACFPGDVPFRRSITETHARSGVLNLSSFTMSPHVGTHADAPGHIGGGMEDPATLAGALPLEPYIGPAIVVDLSPWTGPIPVAPVRAALERIVGGVGGATDAQSANPQMTEVPRRDSARAHPDEVRRRIGTEGAASEGAVRVGAGVHEHALEPRVEPASSAGVPLDRVLIRTQVLLRPDVFEEDYASLSVELVEWIAGRGVRLVGLDTPSVDPVRSKELPAHRALLAAGIFWLENLDLSTAEPGVYFLVAPPARFIELEAAPVRAVLLAEAERE